VRFLCKCFDGRVINPASCVGNLRKRRLLFGPQERIRSGRSFDVTHPIKMEASGTTSKPLS
jgi:hypothetical protein